MGVVDLVILIGAILLAIEGVLKIIKPDFRNLRMTMPTGITLAILGIGLALKALGY